MNVKYILAPASRKKNFTLTSEPMSRFPGLNPSVIEDMVWVELMLLPAATSRNAANATEAASTAIRMTVTILFIFIPLKSASDRLSRSIFYKHTFFMSSCEGALSVVSAFCLMASWLLYTLIQTKNNQLTNNGFA